MKLAALLVAALLGSPFLALAGQPVTVNDKTNTYSMVVDSSGAHFVCDSGCGGGAGSTTITGPLGTQTIANSVAVTNADGTIVTLGLKTDVAIPCTVTSPTSCTAQQQFAETNQQLAVIIADIVSGTTACLSSATAGCTIPQLQQLEINTLNGATPPGTNMIGYVGGDAAAGTASTHVLSVQGIASMTALQIAGTAASGASDTDVPVNVGGRAATAIPTAVADGQKVAQMMTPEGKSVTVPYAPDALRLRGAANTTGSGATTLIAAQGASVKLYITAVQCFRTDTATSALYVTLNDSASTTVPVPPPTGGAAISYGVPLDVAANTALQFTPSASITTTFCNAQGYKGN